jgi:Cysteine-rich CPCC
MNDGKDNVDEILEKRQRWFEFYTSRIERGVMKPPQAGVRYLCPCCGYPTLSERGRYEICKLCSWEDDGQDDPFANEVWGGPNGPYSLSQARENFKRYLIMYDPNRPSTRIGGNSNTPTEERAKRVIIEAFDAMQNEAEPSALDALWHVVYDNERILEQEIYRKAREYEVQAKTEQREHKGL